MFENKKEQIQCLSCKHNIQLSSCGGCSSTAIETVKKFTNTADKPQNSKNDIQYYKYSCNIVINDPNDFDVVNPLNCKYFLSKYLSF